MSRLNRGLIVRHGQSAKILALSSVLFLAAVACTGPPSSESAVSSTVPPQWHIDNEVDATCRALEGSAGRVSACFQLAESLYRDGCSIGAFREVIQEIDRTPVNEMDLRKYGCRTTFQSTTTTLTTDTTDTTSSSSTTTPASSATTTLTTSTTTEAEAAERSQSWVTLTDATHNTDIIGLYPMVDDEVLDSAIEVFIETFLERHLPELDANPFEGYRSELRFRIEPMVINEDIASFRVTGSAYVAGGASPTQFIEAYVPTREGLTIDPLDGFTDGGKRLLELVTREVLGHPDYNASGSDIDSTSIAWIPSVDGMIAGFDEYEIAPGYLGAQEIEIPWQQLADVIDPSGIYESARTGQLTTEPLLSLP